MPIGWGEFFALASAVCWAFAIILFRRAGDALPPFELNLFKNVLGLMLVAPTLAVIEGFQLAAFSLQELGVTLLSGFLGIAVADTWYLRALSLMGASRTGIVASLLSPFVILLSILFLGESLRGWQLAGFALVMAGILLVTWRQNRREVDAAHLGRGVFYGVGAMFMMAVGIVMVKEILETRPFLWTTGLRLLGGVSGMLIYLSLRGHADRVMQRFMQPLPWRTIIIASFLGAYVSMMMWLAGYKLIPASEASVLNETANAWIVLLAWLMLGEMISSRKIAGIVLTSIGVVIMLLA
ncbi:MAG: DMT family transporter [Xanthomonadales bacterium]|nr:DMT family transporter [Gammaproteobacteria bacterium]MBT8053630.1 DMT family transporter [Gammaproteobacteria bacterium]NND58592.1 DMT family transporter [Xanthomonadales bacterium]NNK51018.1 DMT family transporter [Xanthomonadales bacterium]